MNPIRLPKVGLSSYNISNEVWLHDLHSTVGTWLDGARVHGKQPLMGVHDVKIGNTPLLVWSRQDLIA